MRLAQNSTPCQILHAFPLIGSVTCKWRPDLDCISRKRDDDSNTEKALATVEGWKNLSDQREALHNPVFSEFNGTDTPLSIGAGMPT